MMEKTTAPPIEDPQQRFFIDAFIESVNPAPTLSTLTEDFLLSAKRVALLCQQSTQAWRSGVVAFANTPMLLTEAFAADAPNHVGKLQARADADAIWQLASDQTSSALIAERIEVDGLLVAVLFVEHHQVAPAVVQSMLSQFGRLLERLAEAAQLDALQSAIQRRSETQETLMHTLLDAIESPVMFARTDGVIGFSNRAAEQIFSSSKSKQNLVANKGRFAFFDQRGVPLPTQNLPLMRALTGENVQNCEIELRQLMRMATTDGKAVPRWMIVNATPILAADGKVRGAVTIMHDITEQKRLEEERERMLRTDALTSLSNRRGFFERAPRLRMEAIKANRSIWVLYADLDGLKQINDEHGHAAGDEALRELASILSSVLGSHAEIARQCGDEIAATWISESDFDASRVQIELQRVNAEPNRRFPLHCSLGVECLAPDDTRSLDQVLGVVDQLMYARKGARR